MNSESNILFNKFAYVVDPSDVPKTFAFLKNGIPHKLCILAAEELKHYLSEQKDIDHNFGLQDDLSSAIGKMFGILVVKNAAGEIGYLAGFSGKIGGTYHHKGFVPPVFDSLTENSFLNVGMRYLTEINLKIADLNNDSSKHSEIAELKEKRKRHSHALQFELFEQYSFLNQSGETKNLNTLFADTHFKNPPSGAGDCAGPKLIQYAFQHGFTPLAIAEFWWGYCPKTEDWKHGQYYACCRDRCGPILKYMLADLKI